MTPTEYITAWHDILRKPNWELRIGEGGGATFNIDQGRGPEWLDWDLLSHREV